jgi:hypothetical protein
MSPLETLAPDQRAVLELVLRQGRSYGELSELLGIPERDVRARADAGLRALAGEPDGGVDTGRIADWLLGQQPDAEAERTRAAVARNQAARGWAAAAAERLRELEGAAVPDVPDADEPAGAPTVPGPTPRRAAPAGGPPRPASSKLGGAILIGVIVLVVGGLLYVFLSSGDDEDPDPAPAAQQEPEPTADPGAAEPTGNDIVLNAVGGSGAEGLMRLFNRENGTVQFAIAAQNVPPNEGREVYAVWFTREGGTPRRLGFAQAQVGEDGVLTTGGPQQGDEDRFPRWFATYDKVLVSRETNARATEPGRPVLEGTLPGAGG